MAATRSTIRVKGLSRAVIQALTAASPSDGYRVAVTRNESTYEILTAKGFISPPPASTVRSVSLTAKGCTYRLMLLDIAARYRNGNSASSISRIYGVSDKTVQRYLICMDVPIRKRASTLGSDVVEDIVTRFTSEPRVTKAALANEIGVGVHTIDTVLTRHGARRPRQRGYRDLGPEERDGIAEGYARTDMVRLAQQYGTTPYAVRAVLRDKKIPIRPSGRQPATR
ncbi:hypothetical protein ACFZAM_31950 [Streptomyces sp. NPDC008079]|uniref:hypothetical protein n=1 Tax=Streptomyces sp. NPDC008079 TaxID=3364806 RepID=UPI0036E8BB76